MIPALRPYQQAQLDGIANGMAQGQNRLLLQAATGTGKTVTFAAILEWPDIKGWLDGFAPTERKMLVIAHREELLDQAAQKIMKANPSKRVSVEQGERYASRTSDVVVASIQTLQASRFRRLFRLMAHHVFRVVVIDEAHHAAAPTYRTALAHLGFLPMADVSESGESEAASFDDAQKMQAALAGWDAQAPKDRVLVGVTATPNRSDDVGLDCVFQSLAFAYPMKDAIRDGWLVRIKSWVIESAVNLDGVRMQAGDFNQKQLADAVNQDARNKLAVAGWQEKAEGLPTLAFTVDVAHAHALALEFIAQGVRAVPLSGETPKDERRGILRRFAAGEIDVITNCMVLTEGTDLPRAACIVHAKPTKSATLYEQMTGRVLRPLPPDPVGPERLGHPGPFVKPYAVVIDVVDVTQRHSLMAAPCLAGLPPSLVMAGEMLDDVEQELADMAELHPGFDLAVEAGKLTLEQLRAKARAFDIFTIPDLGDVGRGLFMDWTKIGDGQYGLTYPHGDGYEDVIVRQNALGHWDVVVKTSTTETPETGKRKRVVAALRVLAQGLPDAPAALRCGEGYIVQERRTAMSYTDKRSAWKLRPASDKQRARLAQLGGTDKVTGERRIVPAHLTAGQASKLIDLLIKQKKAKRETSDETGRDLVTR